MESSRQGELSVGVRVGEGRKNEGVPEEDDERPHPARA